SRRPHLALASVWFFLILMLVGFYTYAQTETGGDAEFRYTFENRSYFNGLTFALHAFYFGFLLVLPIFVATEGGAQLAGDTGSGVLLLLLSRPVSRARVFFSKLAVATSLSMVLVVLLLLSALLLGLTLVGWGDLDIYPGVLQMTQEHQHLPQGTALMRFALAVPAAALALLAPLSLSFLVSTWTRSAVNAVGTSVALYLVAYVIAEIHFFKDLRPWLFTSYMAYWRELFQVDVDGRVLADGALRLLGFSFVFLALAYGRFRRREER
ncbi:MAG: ABC transporter permease subunit, partial [Gemmatimonadetes bacterium]|nr:ABC transporter permease subunit [Gemmatimonadota bacterium]